MQYKNALHLFPKKESNWEPKVLTCSAVKKTGIAEIWQVIEQYSQLTRANGYFYGKRNLQSTFWMRETIDEQLKQSFYQHPEIKEMLIEQEQKVLDNKVSSFVAAGELLNFYSKLKEG
jgi:LAO/AO transport system kinase